MAPVRGRGGFRMSPAGLDSIRMHSSFFVNEGYLWENTKLSNKVRLTRLYSFTGAWKDCYYLMIDAVMLVAFIVKAIVRLPTIRQDDRFRQDPLFDDFQQRRFVSFLYWHHEYATRSRLNATKNLKFKCGVYEMLEHL